MSSASLTAVVLLFVRYIHMTFENHAYIGVNKSAKSIGQYIHENNQKHSCIDLIAELEILAQLYWWRQNGAYGTAVVLLL